MTTGPAVLVSLAVLAAAGLLPVVAAVGVRWVAVPLVPLGGAVVAALAATGYLALGGAFMGWFVALAVTGATVTVAYWGARPDRRPWRRRLRHRTAHGGASRLFGSIGALTVFASCAWCLRGMSTPTVGFDARAVWLMRSGWFLQPHHQLLVDMRVKDAVIIQSAYPPLVSASNAVAWSVTGDHSFRLGVIVIAALNVCALAAAALSLVELGRRFSVRLSRADDRTGARPQVGSDPVHAAGRMAPMMVGVIGAALLVFVASGITEPFMTNGYADPIWSLAAVGAVAYGLQAPLRGSEQAATTVLLLVAGMSKVEGAATAVVLIALVASRALLTMPAGERRHHGWRPLALGASQLALVGAWPLLMRVIDARGASATFSPVGQWTSRRSCHLRRDGALPPCARPGCSCGCGGWTGVPVRPAAERGGQRRMGLGRVGVGARRRLRSRHHRFGHGGAMAGHDGPPDQRVPGPGRLVDRGHLGGGGQRGTGAGRAPGPARATHARPVA